MEHVTLSLTYIQLPGVSRVIRHQNTWLLSLGLSPDKATSSVQGPEQVSSDWTSSQHQAFGNKDQASALCANMV